MYSLTVAHLCMGKNCHCSQMVSYSVSEHYLLWERPFGKSRKCYWKHMSVTVSEYVCITVGHPGVTLEEYYHCSSYRSKLWTKKSQPFKMFCFTVLLFYGRVWTLYRKTKFQDLRCWSTEFCCRDEACNTWDKKWFYLPGQIWCWGCYNDSMHCNRFSKTIFLFQKHWRSKKRNKVIL